MFRATAVRHNYYLRASKQTNPLAQIRSGPRWWTKPERLLQHKLLYFTLGVDTLPLRRVGIIRAERRRMAMSPHVHFTANNDPTGYRRQRVRQVALWYKRCQYQEFWLQHLYTRFAWGKTGYYPSGGGKIAGASETGVWGYDVQSNKDRYTREPLPAVAREIYERRK